MTFFDLGHKQMQPVVSFHLMKQYIQPFSVPGAFYAQTPASIPVQDVQQDNEERYMGDGAAKDQQINFHDHVPVNSQPKPVPQDIDERPSTLSLTLSVVSQNPQPTQDLIYNYTYPHTLNYNYPPAYNYTYPTTYNYYGNPHQRYEKVNLLERTSEEHSNLGRAPLSPRTKRRSLTGNISVNPNENLAVSHETYSKPAIPPSNNPAFPCPNCSKVFLKQYNLKFHMNSHSTEKPFQCSKCPKTFARSHDKKRHELLHNGVKNFKCEGYLRDGVTKWGCRKKFARSDALSRHFRTETGWLCIRPLVEEATVNDGSDHSQFSEKSYNFHHSKKMEHSQEKIHNHPQLSETFVHPQDKSQFPVRVQEPATTKKNSEVPLVPQMNSQGDDEYYKSMMGLQTIY
jgi:uncharacterized Zn-finger protein